MASKNTKQTKKQGLEAIPVHPITLEFHYQLKPLKGSAKDLESVGTMRIEDLPQNHIVTLVVTKLKGFQHDKPYVDITNADWFTYYKCTHIMATSRSGEPVKTSLLDLTSKVGLLKFMKDKAVKLYILDTEHLTYEGISDRNYCEIAGKLQQPDESKHHLAYVSKGMASTVNKVITSIRAKRKVIDEAMFSESPLLAMDKALGQLVSPQQVQAYKEREKELKQANRVFLLKAK